MGAWHFSWRPHCCCFFFQQKFWFLNTFNNYSPLDSSLTQSHTALLLTQCVHCCVFHSVSKTHKTWKGSTYFHLLQTRFRGFLGYGCIHGLRMDFGISTLCIYGFTNNTCVYFPLSGFHYSLWGWLRQNTQQLVNSTRACFQKFTRMGRRGVDEFK